MIQNKQKANKIDSEFRKYEIRNYTKLEKLCKKNDITVWDFLKLKSYNSYARYKESLRSLPRKEMMIDEILSKVPKRIEEYTDYPIQDMKKEIKRGDSAGYTSDDLIYADNEICCYDCHDGYYIYVDTHEALGFKKSTDCSYYQDGILYVNDLSEALLDAVEKKEIIPKISVKYSTYDCIRENCYIIDYLEKEIEENKKTIDYKILCHCKDFSVLKENLSEDLLQDIEKKLESFEYYQRLYDDGKIDIIEEYKTKYGASDVIDWYEGTTSTESLIDSLNYNFENET